MKFTGMEILEMLEKKRNWKKETFSLEILLHDAN